LRNRPWEKNPETIPNHIAIIMDGNGRWAKKRGLPRQVGHSYGAKVFKTIARYCGELGVEILTVYAFSTENWKRPAEEVGALMKLFKQYLNDALTEFLKDNIVIRVLGDTALFSEELRELIDRCHRETAANTGLVLNIAMNYGGRAEILRAVRELGREVADGQLSADEIDEAEFSRHLYTHDQPDPELVIRPSGEERISNFLIWQSAYSEFVFMDVLWPDFTKRHLDQAIREFNRRNRRFGGV